MQYSVVNLQNSETQINLSSRNKIVNCMIGLTNAWGFPNQSVWSADWSEIYLDGEGGGWRLFSAGSWKLILKI